MSMIYSFLNQKVGFKWIWICHVQLKIDFSKYDFLHFYEKNANFNYLLMGIYQTSSKVQLVEQLTRNPKFQSLMFIKYQTHQGIMKTDKFQLLYLNVMKLVHEIIYLFSGALYIV